MTIPVIGRAFYGTQYEDHLTGGWGDDTFYMTADNRVTDSIDGGLGSDTVDYGRSEVGVDITLTDPISDRSASGGTVTAVLPMQMYDPFTDTYLNLSQEHQVVVANLTSIENATGSSHDDVLNGNSLSNVLNGGAGNDTINGGGGDDTIIGGTGTDVLTGGSGNDKFVFNHRTDSPAGPIATLDHITDFVHGEDHIDLSGLASETTGQAPLSFIGAGPFTGHAGEVSSTFSWQGNIVSVDLDGDKQADLQILVSAPSAGGWASQGWPPLQASDFVLHH